MKTNDNLALVGLLVAVGILIAVFAVGAARHSNDKRFPDAQWVYVGTQGAAKSDGTRFHLDKSSILVSGDTRTFWLKAERAESSGFPFTLTSWHIELDCVTHRSTLLEVADSDEYGNISQSSIEPATNDSIPPQTNLRAAEAIVCHRG